MNHGGFEQTELLITKADMRSAVRLFSAEPTPLEEKNLGTLFAVCEIDSQDKQNEQILNLFLTELATAYYASESFEIEGAFEHALHKLNQKVSEVVGEVGEDWLRGCNMIIGVHKSKQIIFTHIGRVIGIMCVRDQLVDIIDSGSRVQELNPVKFFSNIVAGEIPEKGVVIFATEGMMDYLSRETVRRILSSQSPADAAHEFTELLSVDTGDRNFVGYIMEYAPGVLDAVVDTEAYSDESALPRSGAAYGPIAAQNSSVERTSVDSMSSLMSRQQQTADLLTSSLWPSLKKTMKEMVTRTPSEDSKEDTQHPFADVLPEDSLQSSRPSAEKQSNADTAKAVVVTVGKTAGVIALQGLALLQKGFIVLWHGVQSVIAKARGKQTTSSGYGGMRRSDASVGERLKNSAVNGITKIASWFSKLSIAQKIFVIVAIVVFVVFAQSIVNNGSSNVASTSASDDSAVIQQVDLKINDAKAAEIVNGDARSSYIAARDLLATLPKTSKAYKQRGAELEKLIADGLKKTNKVTDLGDQSPTLDFSSISNSLQVNSMILLGASLYAFDANNGSAYRGNLENSSVTAAVSDSNTANKIIATSKASLGTGLVVQSGNRVGTFNPVAQSISPAALSFGTPAQNIILAQTFGIRIYTLDTGTNQIVRNKKEADTFTGGENWLTDSTADVRNAVDMAIDGAIYVLSNNGSVARYDAGKKSNFALQAIDPALSSGTALATDENTTNIYVADAANKRVVVYDKKGTLVAQYTSNSWNDIVDVIPDEANKNLYILTKNGKVFKAGL